jgi:hypothetical protein
MVGAYALTAAPLSTAVLVACTGMHAAITVAAAVPPVVKRNSLREGFDGPDFESSGIGPPLE